MTAPRTQSLPLFLDQTISSLERGLEAQRRERAAQGTENNSEQVSGWQNP